MIAYGPAGRLTPVSYQGPAQHTWTAACAGFHDPGPCPGDFLGHCTRAWREWLANHDEALAAGDLEEAFKDGFSAGAAYRDFTKAAP